ncbi:HAD superfamily hydrolase (TIGR01509 family)/HAD superfamily hydrolase (TIGR01549 family) [Saccharothrix australiensis]|uniref:HAD superfamily hydrolase (TIGR01509 family)/HAD superfamily hydrolase (TIGR01549 family) n=1 Tax=Saccharothrix australiensis TaxID=2072 RepID=A0A495WCC6_9PSEU|nr:HAD superfamily hydrolase (TIGR01509 family)/HAD superfamily hydrolase (TIGR01549 family) [Saccharothrix australiensis]
MRGLVLDFGGVLTDYGDDYTLDLPPLAAVAGRVRRRGVRTAILSNADGLWSPPDGWEELFDVVVTSGEVGCAKPDRRIYLLVAERLGLAPDACVFVDDLAVNVRGAAAAGMVGVHHRSVRSTLEELEVLLEVPLRG